MVSPYVAFLVRRAIILAATLVIATILTVVIANLGGYIDKILISQIEANIAQNLARNPEFGKLPEELQKKIIEERVKLAIHAIGLDQPFIIRIFLYTYKALTFSLGRAFFLRSGSGSSYILDIILERLPWTILLFVTGTLISAAIGIYLGLKMAQRALSPFDRLMSMYAIITQSFPAWFIGILLILVFAFYLHLFPAGGFPPYREPIWLYALDVLYYMALPLIAWVFVHAGYWAYITRNIVVGILGEDYVMAAKARGIPEDRILRRYVLRPASPPIVTSVALMLVFSLQGAIITETVFRWPGLGSLYWAAIEMLDAPVVIQLTIVYAYLLVITVFLLDIIYSILDPRVKTGAIS